MKFFQRVRCTVWVGLVMVLTNLALQAAEAREHVVLQLSYTHQFQFAGVYAAQFKGYFAEEGLEVEYRTGSQKRQAQGELIAGRAQYGICSSSTLLNRLRGEPLVMVAPIMQHSPVAVAVLRNSDVRGPEDLRGRRLATSGLGNFPEIWAMLTLEGVNPSEVHIVPDKWDIDEIVTGVADAEICYVTDVPFDLQQQGHQIRLIRASDYSVDAYGDCLFTSEAEARAHPRRVEAFRRALLRGWQYAVEHPDEMVQWIMQNLPDRSPRATTIRLQYEARQTIRLINANVIELGHSNPARWEHMANLYLAMGLVKDKHLLAGFALESEGRPPLPAWVSWLVWGLGAAVAVALLSLFTLNRLRRLVDRRTQELRDSEQRQRELFVQSPTPITIEDFSPVGLELEKLRQAGIHDLRAYLAAHPELVPQWHGKKRILDANQQVLQTSGYQNLAEMNTRLTAVMTDESYACFVEELVAIWEGRDQVTMESRYRAISGQNVFVLLNWRVLRKGGKRDLSSVQISFTDITPLKQAEQDVRESERRYHELFELSPLPLVEFDYRGLEAWFEELRAAGVQDLVEYLAAHPELRQEALRRSPLREVNTSALKLLGATSMAQVAEMLPAVLTPEAIQDRLASFAALWRNQGEREGEIPLRLLNGELRYFRYSWRMPKENGRLTFRRSLTAFVDVTEQHRAAAALRESEERYRLLFSATPNPMYIFDAETLRFAMVNEAMIARYGYTREECAQMTVLDIRPPDEARRLSSAMLGFNPRNERPGERHAAGIWHHRCKDGTILDVEIFTHSLRIDGRSMVLVLPFDMTAKVAAERALRESEARYRTLFENAAGGIFRSDAEGRFLSVNRAFARMLGYEDPAELIRHSGPGFASSLYVQPGRREEFCARIAEGADNIADFESEVRTRDGGTAWISENIRVMRDAQGQLVSIEGFVSDITARRRLEAELLRASKLEAVGILAGGIAHDFNNILTVVLGNVTLAEMDSPPGGSVDHMLRDAKQATLRARDLTQQLLTFAKGGDPVRATVDLPEVLRESTGFALHGAKARADFDLPADLWPANADKGQLGQVVQNLVINAVQAMPQGGTITLRAANVRLAADEVGTLVAGDYVRLDVIDTGIGIAPDYLPKIFDPYFTTKQQGSGLGLATVYSIIRKHQGHIEVESRLGEGTRFRLWLPAAREVRPAAPVAAPVTTPLHGRVLFMDDEAPIRDMCGLFIERLGMSCTLTSHGAEAVEVYRQALASGQRFDVVLMDLTVPGGMGGREALEKLRLLDPDVRAIVSSGYSRDPVLGHYREHGFCGILPKPYGPEQLQQALRQALQGSQPPFGG